MTMCVGNIGGGWVSSLGRRPKNERFLGTSLIACIVEEDYPHVGKLLDLTSDLISQAGILRDRKYHENDPDDKIHENSIDNVIH